MFYYPGIALRQKTRAHSANLAKGGAKYRTGLLSQKLRDGRLRPKARHLSFAGLPVCVPSPGLGYPKQKTLWELYYK
jgi:hypothetical protein